MSLSPQCTGGDGWIDRGPFPPLGFIAVTMNLAVVSPAQRHGELVTDFSAERVVLRKPKVMGVRRGAAANQAWLFSYEPEVFLVTNATWPHSHEMAVFDIFLVGRSGGREDRLDSDWNYAETQREDTDGGTSPTSASPCRFFNFASNAVSTCLALAAFRRFFAGRIR